MTDPDGLWPQEDRYDFREMTIPIRFSNPIPPERAAQLLKAFGSFIRIEDEPKK